MIKVYVVGPSEGIAPLLMAEGIDFFEAGSEAPEEAARQRDEECGIHVFILNGDSGMYSVAEVVDSAHQEGKICMLHVTDEHAGLASVYGMIQSLGGLVGNGPDLGWIVDHLKELQATASQRHVTKALAAMQAKFRGPYIKIKNGEKVKGVPPVVRFTLQSDPVSEVGVNGCQARDMIEFNLRLIESLNDAFPCQENMITIRKLTEALRWQDSRTADRQARGVEGVYQA